MFKECVCFCSGGVAIGCVGGGNRILACYKASLIGFGGLFKFDSDFLWG